MKFCTRCGNEMFDDAVICTKCGKPIDGFVYNTIQPNIQKPQAPVKESVLVTVFNFISSLLSAASAFFLFLSIAFVYIDVYSSLQRDYNYYYVDSFAYPSWNFGYALVAFLAACVVIVLGSAAFITALVKRQKLKAILSSILNIIIGGLMFTASLAFMILGG